MEKRRKSGKSRTKSAGSRGKRAVPSEIKTRRRAIKLFVCICIFIFAVLFKLAFPNTAQNISEKLFTSIDYKAAFKSVGEGISGEKKFTQALGEAYVYAFKGGKFDLPEDAQMADSMQETGAAPIVEAPPVEDINPGASPEAITDFEEADASDADEEQISAMVSAFVASKEEFSDFDLPAGTTYEYLDIDFDFANPLEGTVTSRFGHRIHPVDGGVKFHYGIDIGADKGLYIQSFADGVVKAIGESAILGNYLIIEHANGVITEYGHCSEIMVSSGTEVKKGENIAKVGDTGNATGPCLHFELTVDGVNVNPEYYVTWA